MQLVRGLHNISTETSGCALTIGNFDGVHLGHRAVLDQLQELGGELPQVLLTFEPHPREFLGTQSGARRLTSLAEKLRRLSRTRLDQIVVARFDAKLAAQEPEAFIRDVLCARLQVKVLVVGDDFHFGRRGRGDYALLCKSGEELGFEVHRQRSHLLDGRRISSTWVRECLESGDIARANVLLGEPFCIQGRIAHGRALGRTIGFPTANINLTRHPPPISGVFAVTVYGADGGPRAGVANLGRRPTVNGEGVTLEVHIFDYSGDLYGRRLRVELVKRLREERKFESINALVAQIARDADAARECLGLGRPE